MKEEKIYFESQGERIEGILTKPKNEGKSLIILVHGFAVSREGSGGIFIKLVQELVSKNFAVLRFNFRFTTDDFNKFYRMTIKGEISDLKLIINEMSKNYEKIGLVGESFGGSISILSFDEKIQCLVLWYPAIFLRETGAGKNFLSKEATQELKETGFVKTRKSDGREYKVGKEFLEELKKIDIIFSAQRIFSPTLLIHGDNDSVVPFNQSERLLTILKGPKKLEKITRACHAWKNKDSATNYNFKTQQQAIKLTVEWFEEWLK